MLPIPANSSRVTFVAGAALVIAAVAAWSNSFSAPFVFDDRPAILANPTLEHFVTALNPPRDGGTVAGRPLVNLSFAFNRALGGTNVAGYHVVNLIIHVLAGLTLFGLVRLTLARTRDAGAALPIAFGAALLWLLHPLQTAAVTYTVQRAESLMGLCFLFTLYAFTRGVVSRDSRLVAESTSESTEREPTPPRNHQPVWLALSVVACALGMLAKEVMAVAPLVVLLFDRTFVARSYGAAWRARRGYYAALAATWLLLAWLVVSNDARAGTAGFASKIPPLDYTLTQCAAILHYLRLVVWPRGLVFDYGTAVVPNLAAVWPQVLAIAVLLIAALVTLRRAPVWGFFGSVFFILLAPSSSIVPIATQTMAEHRMYLPLAVVAIVCTLGIHAFARRRALLIFLPLAVALGAATHARNLDYRDALTLWRDTTTKRPDNSRAHNNLGIELARAQQPAEAAQHFEIALRAAPDDAELHNNFGNVLLELGRPDEALTHFETAVRIKPAVAPAQLNLAHALLQAGRPADAIIHFEAAERLAPLDAESLSSLGSAFSQTNRLPAAIDRYRQAVKRDPRHGRAYYNLGFALARTGELAEAAAALRTSTQLDPANVAAHVNLGNVLLLSNRPAEAASEYEIALTLKPADAQIRANLSRAQAMQRRASP